MMENVECEPCKARNKQKPSVNWCVNCEEALCTECVENHRAMKVSRNHQLVDITDMPMQMNISSQSCFKHEDLSFEYFCVDHDVLCCKECLADTHRTCQKVMSVDIAAKGAKQAQLFVDSVELLQQVLETTNAFIKDRKESMENIEEEVKQVKDTIAKEKQKIIDHIDSLERSLLEDLYRRKDKTLADMKEAINETEKIETQAQEQKNAFELVNTHGTDKQAFLLVHTSKESCADFEEKLATLTRKATIPTFLFDEGKLEETIKSIGSLKLIENPCTVKFVQIKKRQSQIPIVGSVHQLPSFAHDCEIDMKSESMIVSGMTVNDNNMLFLCDFVDNRVLVCDANNEYQYEINTRYAPWDIASIPGTNTVAVSSYDDQYIQFIDTDRKDVVKVIKIDGSKMGGIAASNENLFVAAKGKIYILDHQVRLTKTIKTDDDERTPWLLSLCRTRNIYYIDKKALNCIKRDGTAVFSYTSPDLEVSRKIATDNHDNVYILGGGIQGNSENIHRLRPDGTFIDIVLKQDDGIQTPTALCFNTDCTKLFVSNTGGTGISVFKVI